MGTDVHVTIQVYDEKLGKWLYVFIKQNSDSSIPEFVLSENVLDYEIPNSGPGTSMKIILQEFREWQDYHNHAKSARCYDSFAKLADDRNYYHLTSPLANRGLPEDISIDYGDKIYSCDGRTYFTLNELTNLDCSDMPYYSFHDYISFDDYQFDESPFENWMSNEHQTPQNDQQFIIFTQDDLNIKKREDLYQIASRFDNKNVYVKCSGKYQRKFFIDNLIERGNLIQKKYSMTVRYILGFSS